MACNEADCSRPNRLLRVTLNTTRGLTPVRPLGVHGDAAGDIPRAVVLRRTGLSLKAGAVGQRPAPRLHRMKQNRFVGFAPVGILHRRIDLVEKRKIVEIALRFLQGRLVQRIAGM